MNSKEKSIVLFIMVLLGHKMYQKVLSGVRPVVVTLQNGYTAGRVLSRAKDLKNSMRFQNVFISPDRTADQRNNQQKLVLELKERLKKEPTRRHYITGGRVVSEDRP